MIKRFSVLHRTTYRYDKPVERSTHVLCLIPVHDRLQSLLSCDLTVTVAGATREYDDVFGNRVRRILLETPCTEMTIEARSRVELLDVEPFPGGLRHPRTTIPLVWMPWQRHMLQPFLLPPELPESELRELTEYANSFVERNDYDVVDTLLDLNNSIFREYAYRQGTTNLQTTPFDVYANRRGVCQDFANLFICMARLLGVPRATLAATSTPARSTRTTCRARPRTRGCRCTCLRSGGAASTPPTASSPRPTTSGWRSAATTSTRRRRAGPSTSAAAARCSRSSCASSPAIEVGRELRRRAVAGYPDRMRDEDGPTQIDLATVQDDVETLQGPDEPGTSPSAPISLARRYLTRETIGVGGMGEVRLCTDLVIGRDVAMKVMRESKSGSSGLRARFEREARLQGQLEHPAIVPVYDLGGGFFTMKRVRGHTLEGILRGLLREDTAFASFTLRRLLVAFVQVTQAIAFAHARGVVHRDLKPGNIMLGDFGEVYVLDWGLAKVLGRSEVVVETEEDDMPTRVGSRTAHGALLGTPGYMPPEQARGDHDALDARADVYALGAILFEILTLEPLHRRGTLEEVIESTMFGTEARPTVRAPDAKPLPELDAVCVRATAVDARDRHGTRASSRPTWSASSTASATRACRSGSPPRTTRPRAKRSRGGTAPRR